LKREDAKDAKKIGGFVEQAINKIEDIAKSIVDCAFKVHSTLGPGLLESVYQICLTHDLRKRGYAVRIEVPMPVIYDGVFIETGYRIDMLVEECIIIENKTVETILPVHQMQLLTYLRLSQNKLGFLINWRTSLIKNGIQRIVNGL
jgi:GxxExxY protein